MKVRYLIRDLYQGGTQTYICDLLRFFKKEEDLATEVIVLSAPGIYSETTQNYAGRLTHLGMKHGFDLFAGVCLFFQIKKIRSDLV